MKKRTVTTKVAFVGMLGALSFVLMLFNFPLPFAPSFLKFDIAEMPALFAGFFMGPLSGLEVVIVKLVLKIAIQGTDTAFVGELMNLVGSATFVMLASVIYQKKRTRTGAIISLIVSSVTVSIVFIFLNAYVAFPMYSRLYGMPMKAIIGMGSAVNPHITNMTTLMLYSVFPFNLIKHAFTDVITFLLYKRVGNVLRSKLGLEKQIQTI